MKKSKKHSNREPNSQADAGEIRRDVVERVAGVRQIY